jgi:hypothetical protein
MSVAPSAAIATNDAGQISVEPATPAHASEWNAFLQQQPQGSSYHLFEWSQINEHALRNRSFNLIARDGASVRGVLPLTLVSSPWFGRVLCSMPFVNYGGLVVTDAAAASALLRAAQSCASEWQADYLELRCTSEIETDMLVSTRKISMHIELTARSRHALEHIHLQAPHQHPPQPEERADSAFGRHRVVANVLFGDGTIVAHAGYADLCVRVLRNHSENAAGAHPYLCLCARQRAGRGRSQRLFQRHCRRPVGRWHRFVPTLAGKLRAVLGNDSRRLRARLFTLSPRPFHGGFGRRRLQEKMECDREPAVLVLPSSERGAMPQLNVDNPKYKLAIQIWQKLPLWVTRLIGPPLARSIP